ncbi:winged helix-turn-helix domain-containing protein [Ramlibacter albus]|uniref:Winged helix-turn-helix domain-containing protein n=1 Tax=Ramlibacter albus TaxID=2079448 RepID=A0A923MEQ3_9BURK|nr:winged helix-turn-helix domain-containing protein [Ramlibacter albus]MBC5768084.1 winged helix-turn-helix domain-containing protein [Ramlibacter albus]
MERNYRFGEFELRPHQRQLFRGAEAVPLGGRAFDLLQCLVERHERVVTKAELMDRVWPGTVVEENNLTVQVSALRKLLGAAAVATISGQGYRFTLPLQDGPAAAAAPAPMAAEDKPTVAVLRLDVLDADPRLRLVADGLAEDLVALLARRPGLLVISRASSFLYRPGASLPEVAQQLGARYLVEGSLRGDTLLKVTARLIDGSTGVVLWDGRFEAARDDDAADLQEGIARRVLMELEPELDRAELAAIRRRRPDNLDAWAHYRSGVAAIAQGGWNEEPMALARAETRKAVEIDEEFALARSLHALFTAIACNVALIDATDEVTRQTIDWAELAVAHDPGSPEVLGYSGCTMCDLGERERGMDLLQRALELDPSNVQAHVAYGASLCVLGETDEGLARMRHAMRISPRDRRLGFWSWLVGGFLLRSGQLEEALQEARAASRRDPQLYLTRVLEATLLAAMGKGDDARAALSLARRLRPRLTLDEVARSHGKRAAQALRPLWSD